MQPKAHTNNIRLVCLTSFLSGTHSFMTRAILQPFVLSISSSMAFVGLVDGLTRSLGPSMIQLPGGWLSDRIGRKLPLMIGSVLIVIASITFLAAYFTRQTSFVIIGAVLLGFGTFGMPAKDSLVAESVDKTRRIMTYNLVAFAAASPGIFASFAGGSAADAWGYGSVFFAAICLEVVCLGLFYLFLRESLESSSGAIFQVGHVKTFLKQVFVVPRRISVFILIITIDSFIWGLGYRILYGMLRGGEGGLTLTQIGILGSVAVASRTVFQIPIGRLMAKRGCKTCLLLSEIAGGLALAGIILFRGRGFGCLIPCQVLYGLVPAFWVPAVKLLLVNSVSQHQRAEILGKMVLFVGLAGFLGTCVGGVMYEIHGMTFCLGLNILGAAAMALALLLLVHETDERELVEAMQ